MTPPTAVTGQSQTFPSAAETQVNSIQTELPKKEGLGKEDLEKVGSESENAGSNDIIWPPSDLYSDEPPLETTLHLQQMMLLLNCLHWIWQDRSDYFAAGNLTVYYSPQKRKDKDFRGPDFFVVLDTQPHPRKSWMVWEEEGKYPNVIVELLSDSTASVDRGLKKRLYAETFRTPEYFWFDPDSQEFQGFALIRGQYQPIEATPQGHLWSDQLQLFLGVHNDQLRFFEPDGGLVPTPDEAAIEAQTKAAEAQTKAAEAQTKAAQAVTEAEAAQTEASTAKAEAEAAQIEASTAKAEAEAAQIEASTAKAEAEAAQIEAKAEAEAAKAEAKAEAEAA
ncbi:MAG: Uma2 family endonuclease, partial [Cyanobacteria bacterium J06607_10]